MRVAPARATAATTHFALLAALGAGLAILTLATPFAFRAGGDNAYMAMAVAAGLIALAATPLAERAGAVRTVWLVLGVAVLLRLCLLLVEPLLSSDVYRYVWDGRVQGAGINPYRHVPEDAALAALRDTAVFPNINRSDYAVTIYPPVAQMFFFLVTRISDSVMVMKLALLLCEAGTIAVIMLLLRRIGRPVTRVVAYAWHPLPMWEIANNGHVDALMITLMMAGIWLAIGGRPLRGAIAVTLAALAKPFAALALPALWRPWEWRMPLLVVATVAACYAPYLSVGGGVLGFFTTGYLSEEGLESGEGIWLLAIWRLFVGALPGDQVAYVALSAAVLAATAFLIASRRERPAQATLTSISLLLMLALFLLSPGYPWYYLALTPFVALVGGAPLWAFTIGALLLQEELPFDFNVPILIRKSLLFGAVIVSFAWVAWKERSRSQNKESG